MFIYSLFGLEIGVSIMIFDVIDVIFSEKLLIGESIGFSWVLYLYRKKVVWIGVWNLDCVVDESVDFSGF